jgi:predicted lipoprotein with Yx(FWY)xxD motif
MRRMKLLAVFLVVGLAVAACGNDDNSSTSSKTTTTEAQSSTTAAGGVASTATVSVTPAVGGVKAHLVGPNGHSLYLFEKDKGTTTACTGGCASIWPALTATGTPGGGTGVDAGKLSTADGQVANQVVYNGHLLYYFSGDTASGQTNGTSIKDWYLVSPDGKSIDES